MINNDKEPEEQPKSDEKDDGDKAAFESYQRSLARKRANKDKGYY